MRSSRWLLSLGVGLGVVFLVSGRAEAQTSGSEIVAVSAKVITSGTPAANPVVRFTGIASPSATVTIQRNGTGISTTTAGTDAAFDVTLSDQPTGQQIYEIAATDPSGDTLAPLTFAFDLQPGTTTLVSGVFLGPTIEIDDTAVTVGEIVTVSGFTAPSSRVTLTINSVSAKNFTIQAGADGRWAKAVDTDDVGVGDHTAKARAVTTTNIISAFSVSVNFAVGAADPAAGKALADINLDGFVNLIDFSIMLFFWKETNPANPRADINRDGIVDIIDFSILLFQWTG